MSTTADVAVVGLLATVLGGVAVANAQLWRQRASLLVRAKSLPLVTVQTVAGIAWFAGFAVRNGHFVRPPGTILAMCNLWWFWVAMVGGFGIWAGCTLVRLVRLQTVFISGDPFSIPWYLLLAVFNLPFFFYYGLFLPYMGAVEYRPDLQACLYTSRTWVAIDFVVLLWIFFLMMALVFLLRNVKDDLGENASVRRALVFSFGLWSATLLVQVLGIDDRWIGRTIETTAIVAAVVCFFVLQTGDVFTGKDRGERLTQLNEAFQLSHPDEEGQQSAPATDDVDVEGDAKPPVDPSRAGGRPDSTVAAYASGKGAAVNTRVRQRLFSRAVLGDAAAS